ncbi:hypothetical protein LTR78_002382 [Recurvomyces mirabilis]|uniref:ATP-grasp domain-containing protein n=1 Tax=Recurvomyces mirabilis TaxID=574656 RepID=A0AAE1C476_9PEZI|nr:hypothetical protein LTR78_002382 [Recurvomyces mirabilis]KAK5157311.1 hypothetical protein LTS14_004076 [Recurvomyces mirabilis]
MPHHADADRMLDANSSFLAHAAQDVALIALSIALLPLDTFVVCLSYIITYSYPIRAIQHRRHVRSTNTPYFEPKNILVTGVGMTKGLVLARLFYAAGHNVIGADFEPAYLPTTSGRLSRALKAFHKLSKPDGSRDKAARYTQELLQILQAEKVDIWVSCSGVASAVEDGQAKEMVELVTKCKCVQYDVATTKRLHEKHSFMDYTQSIGLAIPETLTVTSKAAALHFLDDASAKQQKKYVLKYIGTDDAVRGDMTLLPLSSPAQTKAHISRMEISEERPWILQQFIRGPEYCTHALVVKGEVKAFVACPSSELLMHYEALPSDSGLSMNMLRFTQEFAAAGGPSFTGHLSFDFLVEMADAEKALRDPAANITLYPIECNPRAHTAVCLFNDTPEMVDGYLSLLGSKTAIASSANKTTSSSTPNGLAPPPVFPNKQHKKYYWIGHDLIELVLSPLLSLTSVEGPSFVEVFEHMATFIEHLLWWHDGTFEFWDPLPAWWLYHVYWPYQILVALVGRRKWSRMNVSTCKMFMCE